MARVIVLASLLMVALSMGVVAQGNVFEDVTDVVVVEVPVQVIKDGEPVRGLTAADFQITDGRKKREIIGFDVMDLTLTDASGEPVPVPTSAARRHFLFFFDLSFSDPGAIVRARDAATRLVDSSLHPTDLAAVASYSRSVGARLLLGFTPDRNQVKLAIETLGLPQLVETKRDPLGLVITDPRDSASISDTPGSSAGGVSGRPDVDAEIQQLLTMMVGAERQATNRNEILALGSAMSEFAGLMDGIDGRKYVVFLSEGFDASAMLGTRGSSAEEQAEIVARNEASMRGATWEVDSNERFGDTDMQNQITAMLKDFVRADCTIEAVDIGGLEAGSAAGRQLNTQDSLALMASETGGETYLNFNDLGEAMDDMLERTSVTYVLAFQADDLNKNDDKWRKLNVKLAGGPKGARVIHRPGYFPAKGFDQMSGIERQLSGASTIMGGAGGQVGSSVLAAPFDVGGAAAYVPVLVEIDGSSLMAGSADGTMPMELYAYAISTTGEVSDFFVRALGLDLAQAGPALQQSGFKYFGHFDLMPGSYEVRVMVRNGSTGATGVATSNLRVPDFDAGDALVLPLMFPEPQGKWLVGLESEEERQGYPYPFMMQGAPFMPAARPVVRPGEASRISLMAYNLSGGVPDVSAVLYDYAGNRVADVDVVLDQQEAGQDPSMTQYHGSCSVPSVDQGSYKLEVTLEDPASGTGQTSAIEVLVSG